MIGRDAGWIWIAAPLLVVLGWGMSACGTDDEPAAVDPVVGALRLVFPDDVDGIVCNGRPFECQASSGECTFDLNAIEQGWVDDVVLCHGPREGAIVVPMVALVFKDGLPIWTPNLNLDGEVIANARSTAVGAAFLSPYLTALYPETARALLEQTAVSPYLNDLTVAVASGDQDQVVAAIGPVVRDVLAQGTRPQALSDVSRKLGMDNIEIEQTGGYITLDSRLGTSVDHVCAVYAMPECSLDSEAALSSVDPATSFDDKRELARVFVASKSYFKLQNLAMAALSSLFGGLIPTEELEAVRLDVGKVHDVQCYSGALGLGDEEDRRSDGILIAAEADGSYLANFARVSNLISLAIDTLRLFVDFDRFDGGGADIATAVSICTEQALGPGLALADGASKEEWFSLIKVVQGCAVKRLGVYLAKRGIYALAAVIFDFATDGGGGFTGKISRVGQLLDRVLGMTVFMSPVQRELIANRVDFAACEPCLDDCPAMGTLGCADRTHTRACAEIPSGRDNVPDCLQWLDPTSCGSGRVCEGEGECVACGELGQPCCGDETCAPGNSCAGDVCVDGCRDECPAVGAMECLGSSAERRCGEFDGDVCLEWQTNECGVGEICDADRCGPPTCTDECAPDALQCDGDVVERCGECDDDPCHDWCEPVACEAHFACDAGACVCQQQEADLPGEFPGDSQDAIDDSGIAVIVPNSLVPEGDIDVFSAYVADTAGDTIEPRVEVTDVEPGLTYDVCVAFQCDPNVNSGEPSSVDCGDDLRTTRDGMPACCSLSLTGDGAVSISVNCTLGGLRDDSGTAYVYLESVAGEQCAPPLRATLVGGH